MKKKIARAVWEHPFWAGVIIGFASLNLAGPSHLIIYFLAFLVIAIALFSWSERNKD